MSHNVLQPAPGLIHGLYPEKDTPRETAWTATLEQCERMIRSFHRPHQRYRKQIKKVQELQALYKNLSPQSLLATASSIRRKITKSGMSEALQAQALAVVGEVIFRETTMRPYEHQLMASLVMLDSRLAEMGTGEGKTLSTILTAGVSALAGTPTHVLTANDYLVLRDGQQAARIFKRIGLSVGWAIAGQSTQSRRDQYACDITYATARELVFDYLKDLRVRKRAQGELVGRAEKLKPTQTEATSPLLRGLCFAVVDEADSIFLDEATTPLILSRPGKIPVEKADYEVALNIAKSLDKELHFRQKEGAKGFDLTVAGEHFVKQSSHALNGLWNVARFRDFMVCQALSAIHLHKAGRDYVIREGKVEIVDQNTGRIAEGRQWNNGLHQLVEIKEGCELSPMNETIAQITYQTFFPRYLKLAGTSATLSEASGELLSVYGLITETISRRQKNCFEYLGLKLHPSSSIRWGHVVERTRKLQNQGRPVLIGTDSVNSTLALSEALTKQGIIHTILTADQDKEEANIVATAGQPRQVTVTTNMAGRGTDIKISEDVRRLGGLHVINCQFNGSGRIDRQILGRSARQGDPGSGETQLALDDLMFQQYLPIGIHKIASTVCVYEGWISRCVTRGLTSAIRFAAEQTQREARKQLRQSDKQMRDWLALSGAGE